MPIALIDVIWLFQMFRRRRSHTESRADAPAIESDIPIRNPEDATIAMVSLSERIARFVRHPDASVPMTIAITGEWGSGKSSLMNLLKAEVRIR